MIRRSTSLRVDLAVWFALHPDDTLNAADAAIKFDVDKTQTYACLRVLHGRGYVDQVPNEVLRAFRLGPALRTAVEDARKVA